jgi:hypothetical protein
MSTSHSAGTMGVVLWKRSQLSQTRHMGQFVVEHLFRCRLRLFSDSATGVVVLTPPSLAALEPWRGGESSQSMISAFRGG